MATYRKFKGTRMEIQVWQFTEQAIIKGTPIETHLPKVFLEELGTVDYTYDPLSSATQTTANVWRVLPLPFSIALPSHVGLWSPAQLQACTAPQALLPYLGLHLHTHQPPDSEALEVLSCSATCKWHVRPLSLLNTMS